MIHHTKKAEAQRVLSALEGLDDEELRAVIARAQGLLLDRPVPAHTVSDLAIEVVGHEESRLLACYRALAPLTQRRAAGYLLRLVRTSRRLAHRPKLRLGRLPAS